MDDMRQRYRAPRHDYTQPSRQPAPAQPKPTVIPPKSQAPTHTAIPQTIADAYRPPPRPAQPAHQPNQRSHQPPAAHHHAVGATAQPARKKRHVLKKMVAGLVILAILGGAAALAYPKLHNTNPFSKDITSQAQISLYYPQKLPAGYSIEQSSIHLDNGVLTYAATKGDLRLVFTSEQVPGSLNFNAFNKQYLANSQEVSNAYATAVVGLNKDRNMASFVAGKTWFILTTNNASIPASDLSLVISNLKKY